MLNGLRARRDLHLIFLYNSARASDLSFRDLGVPLNLAFPEWSRRIVRKSFANIVKRALLAAGTRIEHEDLHSSVRPLTVLHLRHVVTVLARIMLVLHELVSQELLEVGTDALQFRNAVHDITCQVKAIQIVHDGHIERSCGSAFFFITAHMEIVVTMSAIAQPMNEPRITVIGEDHGFVGSEHGIKFGIRKSVGMFAVWL